MLACVYGTYLIVGNKLLSGSFDVEVYILGYIYMEVFSLPLSYIMLFFNIQPRAQITFLYI